MKKKCFLIFLLMVGFSLTLSGDGFSIPAMDFNEYVLRILKSYPMDGTHRYYWPSHSTWIGITRDLFYRNALFAKGDPQGRCYCCGLTFEVFFRAYKRYCEERGWPFVIKDFDIKQLRRFQRQWFGSDGNPKTLLHAIVSNGLGRKVELEEAMPGDFVQFWRHNGSGHSVIFIAWIRDLSGKIIGLQYWSTQRSTNGIGYFQEYCGIRSGIDIHRIYIARIGRPN